MVSTSKILTVSYGTFSCTLEGFDESFETMKAIAEYFRDLAANDRYFGAEPPTPDAEMLARIAEREIARRVEAHETEGRIVLRAAERTAPQPEPQPQPAPAVAEEAPQEEAPQKAAQVPAARDAADPGAALTAPFPGRADEQTAAAAEAAEETAEPETPDSVGLAEDTPAEAPAEMAEPEIAAAAAEAAEAPAEEAEAPSEEPEAAQAEAEAPEAPEAPEAAEEPETSDAAPEAAPAEATEEPEMAPIAAAAEPLAHASEDEAAPAFDTEALAEDAALAEEEALSADETAEPHPGEDLEIVAEDAAEETEEATAPEPAPAQAAMPADEEEDSVAARLRRIRSVVARSAGTYGSDDYLEDEHAQEFLERTAAELDATLAEDDAADAPEAETEAEIEEDPLGGLAARLAEDREDRAAAGDEDEGEDDLAADLSEDTLAQLLADAMPAEAEEAPLVLSDAEQVETGSEPRRPLRARVVKMKRSEFEAAIAEGRIEEDLEDDESFDLTAEAEDGDDDDFGENEAILSPEDEAELQRELAEVEAELTGDAEPSEAPMAPAAEEVADDDLADQELADTRADASFDEAEEDWPAPEQAAPEAPRAEEMPEAVAESHEDDAEMRRGAARLQRAGAAPDATRLFDEADTQFEAPDSSRRRNAIQHLRAAVAATKAEKTAGSRLEREPDEKPYRSDLASVVRPRRPQQPAAEGSARSRRPAEDRQAPLKLVAEQRVDTPRAPVRPRRVSAHMGEAAADATHGGFSDYAERIGAHTLPELLEAAAAYMADVEGRQQFSRPMLMGKLKEVERESFSREDGLRSFGHLLRQGKLQKLKGGRFSVTDQTEFRAKRQAG